MGPGPGKLLGQSKLSSKNQVVIPAEVRQLLNLKPGDQIVFIEERGKIILMKGPIEVKV